MHVIVDAVEVLGTGRIFRMGRLCYRLQRVCRIDRTLYLWGFYYCTLRASQCCITAAVDVAIDKHVPPHGTQSPRVSHVHGHVATGALYQREL